MITAGSTLQQLAINPIRKPTSKVYIMWDGVNWTDETSRLKSASGFEEMGGGLFEEGISEIDVTFYNGDHHFSLNHANCSITQEQMVPKRKMYAEIGFDDENIVRFTGYIESYVPDIGAEEFRIHAFDKSYTLKSEFSGYVFLLNQTPTELIEYLGNLAGIDSSDMVLDTTTDTIGFAYFEDRSIWFLMSEIAAAEGGRVFFDNNNKLNFWNRSHISFASTPVFTFMHDDYILRQPYEISDKDIKNKVTVKAEARQVYEEQVVWDVDDEFKDEFKRVYAHQGDDDNNLLFSVELENPVTSFVRPLESGVDYTANTVQDGSGSDVTHQIEFETVGSYIKGLNFEIKNNMSSGIAYFTKLQMRGTPAKIYNRVNAQVNNEYSQGLYGIKPKDIANPYIDNYDFAISLAQTQLNMFSNTLANFSSEVVAIPWITPGDIVAVQVTPESSSSQRYLVTGVRWNWAPRAGATMALNLAVNYADYNKVSDSFAFSGEAHSFTLDSGVYHWGTVIESGLVWNMGAWS